jgi:hypothetical protein
MAHTATQVANSFPQAGKPGIRWEGASHHRPGQVLSSRPAAAQLDGAGRSLTCAACPRRNRPARRPGRRPPPGGTVAFPPRVESAFALASAPDELVGDCAAKEVTVVTNASKRPPARQPFAIGDFFRMAAGGRTFVGRILRKDQYGHLVRIYDSEGADRSGQPPALTGAERVLGHFHVPKETFESWRWTILGGHEGFRMTEREEPTFFYGGEKTGYTLRRGARTWRGRRADTEGLEQLALREPEDVEDMVAARAAALLPKAR